MEKPFLPIDSAQTTGRTNLLIETSTAASPWRDLIALIENVPLNLPVVVFSASPVAQAVTCAFLKSGIVPNLDDKPVRTPNRREVFVNPPLREFTSAPRMPVAFYTNWDRFVEVTSLLCITGMLTSKPANIVFLLPSQFDEVAGLSLDDLKWIPMEVVRTINMCSPIYPRYQLQAFQSYLAFRKAEVYFLMHAFCAHTGLSQSAIALYKKSGRVVRISLTVEPVSPSPTLESFVDSISDELDQIASPVLPISPSKDPQVEGS